MAKLCSPGPSLPMELSIEDIAGRAGVDVVYIRKLMELGALGPERNGYREQDAHVVVLLHLWDEARLSAEAILAAIEAGELSLDFLESPGWDLPPPLDRTYRQLAEEQGIRLELLQTIHRSMGFAHPIPTSGPGPTTP
jgi:adenylate cyclase